MVGVGNLRSWRDMKKKSAVESRSDKHYTHKRRKLLQSLAAGGAVVTVKTVPEKWTRPLLETTTLPAHAEMTTQPVSCSLTCEVGGFDSTQSFNLGFTSPLQGNGASGIVFSGATLNPPQTWTISGLEATVSSPAPVSLAINASGAVSLNSAGITTVIDSGTITDFGNLEVTLLDQSPIDVGTVDFTFSACGQSCNIDVTFSEYNPPQTTP